MASRRCGGAFLTRNAGGSIVEALEVGWWSVFDDRRKVVRARVGRMISLHRRTPAPALPSVPFGKTSRWPRRSPSRLPACALRTAHRRVAESHERIRSTGRASRSGHLADRVSRLGSGRLGPEPHEQVGDALACRDARPARGPDHPDGRAQADPRGRDRRADALAAPRPASAPRPTHALRQAVARPRRARRRTNSWQAAGSGAQRSRERPR